MSSRGMPMRTVARRSRSRAAVPLPSRPEQEAPSLAVGGGHALRRVAAERLAGGDLDEVGVRLLHRILAGVEGPHLVDALRHPPLAGGGDEAGRVFGRGPDVDEGAQTLVLAERAAGRFVAGGGEGERLHPVEPDERALPAVAHADRLAGSAEGAALAGVRVDVDLRVRHASFDEVVLGLDHGEVVVCPSLEEEGLAEAGQVRLLDDVEPDVLGQGQGEAGHDLRRLPAELLEVRDVLLQEDGAAVVKSRRPLGAERDVGPLADVIAEAGGRALEEVAVAGRALRVELEVLDGARLHDDDLDVLPPTSAMTSTSG